MQSAGLQRGVLTEFLGSLPHSAVEVKVNYSKKACVLFYQCGLFTQEEISSRARLQTFETVTVFHTQTNSFFGFASNYKITADSFSVAFWKPESLFHACCDGQTDEVRQESVDCDLW